MNLVAPKDVNDNISYRQAILEESNRKPRMQAELLKKCETDLLFWVNTFVYQHNPNFIKGGVSLEVGPFITWPYQDEAFKIMEEAIQNRETIPVEKSREMGASWMFLLKFDHAFLFQHWKKFLVISRSAEAVDSPGDSDSLFWKLDFVHQRLPLWMKKDRIKRRLMRFNNPLTKSSITGQATSAKSGIGGRATAMLIDEFTRIDEDYAVLEGTASTTSCRFLNFTHTGLATAGYELTQREDLRKLVLHWSQHPDKRRGLYRVEDNKLEILDPEYEFPADYQFDMSGKPFGGPFPGLRSPWYDKKCKDIGTDRGIAMDLDINPGASVSQVYPAGLIKELLAGCIPPLWQGEPRYDTNLGRLKEFDKVGGGCLKLWLHLGPDGLPPQGNYVIGGDIALGVGASPSCLTILDKNTGHKVGEYTNAHIEPKDFAALAVALCWAFKGSDGEGAKLIWEVQGPGVTFGRRVIELGYRGVYYRTDEMKVGPPTPGTSPGWSVSPNGQRLLHADYQSALARKEFINWSEAALKECRAFKYDDRGEIVHGALDRKDLDPTKTRVNHADHVIADALAWKLAKGNSQLIKKAESQVRIGTLAWRREIAHNEEQKRKQWA